MEEEVNYPSLKEEAFHSTTKMLQTSSVTWKDRLVYDSLNNRRLNSGIIDGDCSVRPVADVDRCIPVPINFKTTFSTLEEGVIPPILLDSVPTPAAHLTGIFGIDCQYWNTLNGGFIFEDNTELPVGYPVHNLTALLKPFGLGFPEFLQVLDDDGTVFFLGQFQDVADNLMQSCGCEVPLPTRQSLQLLTSTLRGCRIPVSLKDSSAVFKVNLILGDVLPQIQLLDDAVGTGILDRDGQVLGVDINPQNIRHRLWFGNFFFDSYDKPEPRGHLDGSCLPSSLDVFSESFISTVNRDENTNSFCDGPERDNRVLGCFSPSERKQSLVKDDRNSSVIRTLFASVLSHIPRIDSSTYGKLRRNFKAFTKWIVSLIMQFSLSWDTLFQNIKTFQNHVRVALLSIRKNFLLDFSQVQSIDSQGFDYNHHQVKYRTLIFRIGGMSDSPPPPKRRSLHPTV